MELSDFKVTGTQIHYLMVCKRKLWLFSHQIGLEEESELVRSGKVLHETNYLSKKQKELEIDNLIKLDFIDGNYVGEVKSSSKMLEADKAQLYYYLYLLENMGINRIGKIHYPKEKRVDELVLTDQVRADILNWLKEVEKINQLKKPPKKEKFPYCNKCSYYEFCWVGEIE